MKVWERKTEHCCAEILMTGLFRPWIWWGWRMGPSVSMEASHLSFMSGKLILWRASSFGCFSAPAIISTSVDSLLPPFLQTFWVLILNERNPAETRNGSAFFFFFWFPKAKKNLPRIIIFFYIRGIFHQKSVVFDTQRVDFSFFFISIKE